MRIDIQSKIKLESGSLFIIQLEKLQFILEQLTGKSFDEYLTMKTVLDAGGDMISLEPYQEVNIGKMYTLNNDGTNTSLARIAPVITDFKRMLEIGENTAEEYCMQKEKELNFNSYKNDIVGFFCDQIENYKKEMLGEE